MLRRDSWSPRRWRVELAREESGEVRSGELMDEEARDVEAVGYCYLQTGGEALVEVRERKG